MYSEHGASNGEVISVQQITAEHRQTSDMTHHAKAAVDMWLLSFSDHLLTSANSTFGYVVMGILDPPPSPADACPLK